MFENPGQPVGEPVPYDVLIPELEGALHRAVSETVILRARLAARDREIAALRSLHAPQSPAVAAPTVAPERESTP